MNKLAGNRYKDPKLERIWSNPHKYRKKIWERVYKELVEVHPELDLPFKGKTTEPEHEVIAELEALEVKNKKAYYHLGLCSSDIVEAARDLQIRDSLKVIWPHYLKVVHLLTARVAQWSDIKINARTHLHQGSFTTLGYRIAPILEALDFDNPYFNPHQQQIFPSHGLRGAVGHFGPLQRLGIDGRVNGWLSPVLKASGQSPNRGELLLLFQGMEYVAMQLYKLAQDIRLMHAFGELEYDNPGRASSSLVHKKSNPTHAERVCSLARLMPGYTRSVWECGAYSMLERSLDDSAQLRVVIPDAFEKFLQILKDAETMLTRVMPTKPKLNRKAGLAEQATVEYALGGAKSRREAQEMARNHRFRKLSKETGRANLICQTLVRDFENIYKLNTK